jgi:hypothetical protein
MASKDQTPAKASDETRNGEVTKLSPFQKLVRRMADMATMEETMGKVSGEDINSILTAETEEEMWDADELAVYNAAKLRGCELQTFFFEVKYGTGNEDIKTPFTTSDGRQMYLLVHSFRITEATERKDVNLPPVGEEFTWNTSARNIVGKLFWMLDHGWFDPQSDHGPVYFRMDGTPLSGGRYVEKLKELSNPPVNAPSF